MPVLSHRLQVLVDDERMGRLTIAAKSQGVSVGEFVRSAIDGALQDDPRRASQRRFLAFLDATEPIDFGTTDQIRELRDEAAVRPFFDGPA
jgi:hypothetical protein